MPQYSLMVDHKLCFGCFTCQVACKQEHATPPGIDWIKVSTLGPEEVEGKLTLEFVPMACRHCLQPPCVDACPVEGAMTKLSHGAVVIDADLCIGCMACADACPFHAVAVDPERHIAVKCDLCRHRIEKGLPPSCVKHCPSGCLEYGEINEIVSRRREKEAVCIASCTGLR